MHVRTLKVAESEDSECTSFHYYCRSLTKSCLSLCDPMDCRTLGFPVLHHLPELVKILLLSQWCYPTISTSATPFFPAFNLSQHQGLFQWDNSSHQVAKSIGSSVTASVLLMNIQDWFPLGWTGLILLSKGLSRVFPSITIWSHQFFSTQPSLWSKSFIHTWLQENP